MDSIGSLMAFYFLINSYSQSSSLSLVFVCIRIPRLLLCYFEPFAFFSFLFFSYLTSAYLILVIASPLPYQFLLFIFYKKASCSPQAETQCPEGLISRKGWV